MTDPKIIQEWLASADEDLLFAKESFATYDRFYAKICFHFQQAAEKYFKAFLIAHDTSPSKIHDLPKLLKLCRQKESSMQELTDDAKFLTDFYIVTRYPVSWPVGINRNEAEKALEAANRIAQTIKKILKF